MTQEEGVKHEPSSQVEQDAMSKNSSENVKKENFAVRYYRRSRSRIGGFISSIFGFGKVVDLYGNKLSYRELDKELKRDYADDFRKLQELSDTDFNFLDLQINRAYENNKVTFAPTLTFGSICVAVFALLVKIVVDIIGVDGALVYSYIVLGTLILLVIVLAIAHKLTIHINNSKTAIEECRFKIQAKAKSKS